MKLTIRPLALVLSLVSASLLTSLLVASPQEPAPAAAKASKGTPFLWRIEGAGATGYLYGTIHLPDERVLNSAPAVEKAFADSDAFYAEIDANAASEAKVQAAALIQGGGQLDALVGATTWGRIEERFARKKVPALFNTVIKGMKPWAANAMLPMLDYVPDLMAGKAPLDKMLYQRARAKGKTVGGLETVEEQIAVFEIFDTTQQIQMLRESLDLLDRYDAQGRDVMEETVVAWLSGDEERLMSLLDDGFGSDPKIRARAEDALLWKRNVRLADRIADRMKAAPGKTTFFAVGALHMPDAPKPGKDVTETAEQAQARAKKLGVVALLRAKGLKVERVAAKQPVPAGAGR